MLQSSAIDILSRFPGPVTLYPSRRKWMLVLAGCAAFVTIAIWMVSTGNGGDVLYGWLALLFFGCGVLVSAIMMVPGAGSLTLDRDGFEIINMYRRSFFRWSDGSGFTAKILPPATQHVVVFDSAGAAHKSLGRLNTMFAGRNAGLPDTYGLPAKDLAELLSKWRERALGEVM
jgi:hypothetical protein